MLLSVDKVLSLLAEGKSIEKISQMADVDESDVIAFINDARDIVIKNNPVKARKKIKLKKKVQQNSLQEGLYNTEELFKGADLSVIPLESTLLFNVAVTYVNNANTVGIIISDSEDRQVGKIVYRENKKNTRVALLLAMIRCQSIAEYFKAKKARIRYDDEYIHMLLDETLKKSDPSCDELIGKIKTIFKNNSYHALELIESYQNERAYHLTE